MEQNKLLKKYIIILWIQKKYNKKMNTIFMNSENSRKSDPHRLLLYSILRIKQTQEEKINILLYQILAFTIHRKILKSHIRIINLLYQLQHGMKNLNYLMDHILY